MSRIINATDTGNQTIKLKPDNRLTWIDAAKGIGIVLVVYGHVARGLISSGLSFDSFAFFDTVIYRFHMPLFFALSGYFFLSSVKKGSRLFLTSKASTILYPYLIWSLIQVLIQLATSHLINGEVSMNDVWSFYLPRGQFWFLLALFIINLINLLFFQVMKLTGILLTTIVSVVCIGSELDLGVLNLGLNNLVFFNFGILIFSQKEHLRLALHSKSIFAIVITFFVGLEIVTYRIPSIPLIVLCGILGTAAILQLSNIFLFQNSHLIDLGKNSMPIFLMHTIFGSGIRIVLYKFFSVTSIPIHLLAGMLGGVYIPLILYKYILSKKFKFLFSWTSIQSDSMNIK